MTLQPREVLIMAMEDCAVSPKLAKSVAKMLREDGKLHERNRELTRQVEQLRAIVKALLNDRPCGSECEYFHHSKKDQHNYCEPCKPILRWEKAVDDALSALAATPPSSSDPGRNDSLGIEGDTGREER